MTRSSLIEALVLDSVANDYENLETLAGDVFRWGQEHGLELMRSEIVSTLRDLVERGFVRAYILSPREAAKPLRGMPQTSEIEQAFFLSTGAGGQFLLELPPMTLDAADAE